MESKLLLSLVISPEVEDAVVDWLLQQEEISGFTNLPVSGHGTSPHSMSLAEQVAACTTGPHRSSPAGILIDWLACHGSFTFPPQCTRL